MTNFTLYPKFQELQKVFDDKCCHLKSSNVQLKVTGLIQHHAYCCCWAIKHGRGRNDSVSARHIFYSTDSLSCSWRSRTPTTSVISSAPFLPTSTYSSLLSHSPFFHHPQEAWVREIKTFHQTDGRKGELGQPTLSKSWHVSPYSLATITEMIGGKQQEHVGKGGFIKG